MVDSIDITPNPHTHSASGSIGGLEYGVKKINTTSTDWNLYIEGINVTDYINVQHSASNYLGARGEGIYPSTDITSIHGFYDILEVCDMLTDEGEITARDAILSPGFKPVEIMSTAPFGIDMYVYLKYPHSNR